MPRILSFLVCLLTLSCADRSLPLGPVRLRSPLALVAPVPTLTPTFSWPDRRPIAALFIAPRPSMGWIFQNYPGATLADRMNAYADRAIAVMKEMGAQGMILWDGEGWKLDQYLGSPDLITAINSEMKPLMGPFMKRFRDAGLLTGCTLRSIEVDATTGKYVVSTTPYETLLRKAKYAHRYFGCRIFYVDSNLWPTRPGGQVGELLPATIFERLQDELKDSVFFPEHEKNLGFGYADASYFQNSAPYMELRWGESGTPDYVRADVSAAFSVVNISAGNPREHFAELVAAVRRGDILIANGWFRNDDAVAAGEIWRAAQIPAMEFKALPLERRNRLLMLKARRPLFNP